MLRLITFSLIFVVSVGEPAKILGVFPTPSISHQVVFRPLMIELTKRGHEVTVITPDPAFLKGQTPQNFTEIDVHDISYGMINKFYTEKGIVNDPILFFKAAITMITDVFIEQLNSAEVKNFLKQDNQFDLVFVESCVRPALIFSHIMNAPVIEFSSLSAMFQTFESVGAATHPLIYPDPMHRRLYNMTMWEKIIELYNHYLSGHIYREHVHYENDILQKIFGPNTPDLNDLAKNVQMVFLNANPLWDFNRPVPPNVLYLGGMHQKLQSELPQEWKSYLDSSKNGVIYVSFGTNVKPSMLPQDKLKIFIDVFSQLPYDVLWKWDKDELPGRSENIRISKWLPQSDLLRHPKIKLFITQGGLQSTDEALTAGVPLIGVPILGDQWFNVEQYVKFNIGKKLAIETFTENELKDAIKTVIEDKSYRENIVKLHNAMVDQPVSPLERAVWWTEYVLRHKGAAHLRAPTAHMSWAEYFEIKLLLLLLFTIIISLISSLLLLNFIVSKIKKYFNFKIKVN